MSERLPKKHEISRDNPEAKLHQEALKESIEKKAEASRHEHAENIEKIRSDIESVAKHETHKQIHEQEKTEAKQPMLVNKELKDMAYRRTLKRAQSKLSKPERTFSKVIHNPAVETVSEITGKTVARPSGVLAGGICAFLGSSLFLWIARHYGYEYNYFMLAMLFIGGFFVGLLIELGLRVLKRKA